MICPHSKCECEHYKRKKAEKKENSIGFDGYHFTNVGQTVLDYFHNQYPAINVPIEMSKMETWLFANPKNRKSNYMRFITNWLSKAQDKARRVDNIVAPLRQTFTPDWRKPI